MLFSICDDVLMDFDALVQVKSGLGTAAVIVFVSFVFQSFPLISFLRTNKRILSNALRDWHYSTNTRVADR